jgi:hypothetical protein
MKPLYYTLKGNHYSSEPGSADYVSGEDLYKEMGYDLSALMAQNAGYANTCAARMSLALLKSGVSFTGRLKVKAGDHKGKLIEPGAKLLADQLYKKSVFGKATIFTDAASAAAKIGTKKGVVFFWKITGYDGGHIDLVEPATSTQVCHSHCYFNCKEVWFWELKG